KAVDSFDPSHGVPFGTFATIGVCRAIQCFGATAAQLVRIPDEVRARRRRVQRAADYLSKNERGAPSWDTVAEYLEVPKGEVVDAFAGAEEMISLDSCVDGDLSMLDTIADENVVDVMDALAAAEENRSVREALANLEERRRQLVESRYGVEGGEQSSLAQIGRQLGV